MRRRFVVLLVVLVAWGLASALVCDRFPSRAAGKGPQAEKAKASGKAKRKQSAANEAAGDEILTAGLPEGVVTLRVDFRSRGKARSKIPTVWDGGVRVSQGRIITVRAWQEDPRNTIDGTQWKLTTQRIIPWNTQQRKRGHESMPLKDSAVLIELGEVTPQTELAFDTEQGQFEFEIDDVPFGTRKAFLGGLVQVSRAASTATILSAPTEDDFPSAAVGPNGELYVGYVAFTHGDGFRKRPPLAKPPEDFSYLAKPSGGDQVMLLCQKGDAWTGPFPVTPPGQDVYRTATAVSGEGDVWVFWSATRDGNWDLFGRRRTGNRWAETVRLTTDPGPDTFPVATTDRSGRVWVAWQGYREGSFNVFALSITGDTAGEAMVISDAPGNQWTPAIAASVDGQVAIAWDSYEAGHYDVACRVFSRGKFGDRIPVTNSPGAQMRPSITYDAAARLWIAYENGPEKWGKDSGALDKYGAPLYRGRSIAVRVWAEHQLWQPADDPARTFSPMRRGQKGPGANQRLAVPRLACDSNGRVWLAVRSPRAGTRVGVGTVWFEHIACYQGDRWSGEIVCPHTDNLLDNRPAMVPTPSGEIVMIASSDRRFATSGRLPQWFLRQLRKGGKKVSGPRGVASRWPDAVNNELVMAKLGPVSRGSGKVALERVSRKKNDEPDPDISKEAADVARAKAARITVGGKTLQLLRGEFHRHTEISPDGSGDGLLLDMWRYALDATDFDWIGNGDHDNGNGREYSWWMTQKTTDLFQLPGRFTPMYSYERSCTYPDGHRNVVFANRGIRTLPRLAGGMGKAMDDLPADARRPNTPDTRNLYRYLAHFDGVCASHTSGTDMGTDWRDNDPKVEPIVEIYQGCRQNYEMPGAPRSNTADHSIGGWRPLGFISLALKKGYRLGFQSSSDHGSTHISYCNIWAEERTREAILEAMKARHLYGATDNILAEVRCGEKFMGDEFTTKEKPSLSVRLVGTRPFAKVHVIKDGNYTFSTEPGKQEVEFEWTDFDPSAGKTSYYYVRGEQEDGELVWVSPMWITYQP